jgi:hypothetical protein
MRHVALLLLLLSACSTAPPDVEPLTSGPTRKAPAEARAWRPLPAPKITRVAPGIVEVTGVHARALDPVLLVDGHPVAAESLPALGTLRFAAPDDADVRFTYGAGR